MADDTDPLAEFLPAELDMEFLADMVHNRNMSMWVQTGLFSWTLLPLVQPHVLLTWIKPLIPHLSDMTAITWFSYTIFPRLSISFNLCTTYIFLKAPAIGCHKCWQRHIALTIYPKSKSIVGVKSFGTHKKVTRFISSPLTYETYYFI